MWLQRFLLGVMVLEVAWAAITLNGNGYEDIVVGISPMVPEDFSTQLIDAIKKRLTEASNTLFIATHQMLYFRDIKILLPKSWTKTKVDGPATNQRFQASDIRVDLPSAIYEHQPHTDQPGSCGEPGRYIHLTPRFLTNDALANWWGPCGKVLVSEWARLRWGVFDEMGYPNDPQFPLFYWEDLQAKYLPNVCTEKEVVGRLVDRKYRGGCNYVAGKPDENCRFIPDPTQNITSSLMGWLYINEMTEFCDPVGHPHNSRAPTRQNLLCQDQSVWEVMQEHQDFVNLRQAPPGTDTTPKFTVVKEDDANFVMVLDYSLSMKEHGRIGKLWRVAKRWILHEVADGSTVGIVAFAKTSWVIAPMTLINNVNSRRALANKLTGTLKYYTCIGCGIRTGLGHLGSRRNKVMILLSDGEQNRTPYIKDVMSQVITSKTQVITVALGSKADKDMERVAQNTGGKSYTVFDSDDGGMIEEAFHGALTYQPGQTLTETNIKIHEDEYKGSNRIISRSFVVDATVGRNLMFRLDTSTSGHVTSNPTLTSPSGKVYSNVDMDSSINLWTIVVDSAETGTWKWSVQLSGNANNVIRVSVTAQAKDANTLPIYTEAWMNVGSDSVDASKKRVIIYAKVTQGENPVVGANVRAFVTTPSNTNAAIGVDLLDNGQGADMQKGDGVYSRYFLGYTTNGRYNVKAKVWDDIDTFINNGIFTPNRRTKRAARHPRDELSSISPDPLDVPDYCCGSVVPFDPTTSTPTGQFNRFIGIGSLQVVALPPRGDYLPPSQVRDLQVDILSLDNVTLQWTAPGDDLDSGKVSSYEIRMSTNRSQLKPDTFDYAGDDTLIDLSSYVDLNDILLEFGQTVFLTINLTESYQTEKVHYFALRAVDDVGKKSDVSNVVTVAVKQEDHWFGIPKIYFIIIGGCLAMLLIIIILGIITAKIIKRNHSRDSERTPLAPNN